MRLLSLIFLFAAVLAQPPAPAADQSGEASPPPGAHRFESKFSLIPPSEILSGGPKKDGIPALTSPAVVKLEGAGYLKPGDRVLSVEIGGEARAYPLRILIWHEIVNDTIGGRPIAVTYCPLCDSAVVLDRLIGGAVREFGVSGKLHRSNVLMYDRQPEELQESLWSQLQMRAVVGPAAEAGLRLKAIPASLVTWGEWRERHPAGSVLSVKTGVARNYAKPPYDDYFSSDRIGFGAHGRSSRRPDLKNKDRIVALRVGEQTRIYVVKDVVQHAGKGGRFEDELGSRRFSVTHLPEADSLRIEPADGLSSPPVEPFYSFWFAWEDHNPETEIWRPNR